MPSLEFKLRSKGTAKQFYGKKKNGVREDRVHGQPIHTTFYSACLFQESSARPIVKGGRESDIRQGHRDVSLERLRSCCTSPEVEAAEKAHPRSGRTEKETLIERANGEGEGERMFKHPTREGRQDGKNKQRRVLQCLDVRGTKKKYWKCNFEIL
ncbi:hypothetical protein TNCV_3660011 [Trichonephila clavipes]|nr:hypothetical protein TNCV_3660011 [Trichonephila clavipes]